MKTPVVPQTYGQWRHGITVECGIPMTCAFAEERLALACGPFHGRGVPQGRPGSAAKRGKSPSAARSKGSSRKSLG
jgi:hypothetical protein